MTSTIHKVARVETGVRNLDEMLGGGLPRNSVILFAGPPGSGKTITAQQICFHLASAERPILYFSTLSEPTAKTLRYLSQFGFFDPAKLDAGGLSFVDLGVIVRSDKLEATSKLPEKESVPVFEISRKKPSAIAASPIAFMMNAFLAAAIASGRSW